MSEGFGNNPISGRESLRAIRRPPRAIRVLNGPKKGLIIRLEDPSRVRFVVGRDDPPAIRADIDLTECERQSPPVVSRRHAELQWVNGDLQIIDLGSANGTWINGQRLDQGERGKASPPVTLYAGDRLLLANLELELILDPPHTEDAQEKDSVERERPANPHEAE